MRTSLTEIESKLLVDLETGRPLRCDDAPTVSRRWADSHPFVEEHNGSLFVGPDALRRRDARAAGQPDYHLNALEYEIQSEVAGSLRLQRKIDA